MYDILPLDNVLVCLSVYKNTDVNRSADYSCAGVCKRVNRRKLCCSLCDNCAVISVSTSHVSSCDQLPTSETQRQSHHVMLQRHERLISVKASFLFVYSLSFSPPPPFPITSEWKGAKTQGKCNLRRIWAEPKVASFHSPQWPTIEALNCPKRLA